MTSSPRNAKDIFVEMVSRVPPDAWEQRVVDACEGDEALKKRVLELLEAHVASNTFLGESSGAANPTTDNVTDGRIGSLIGPYKLLEQIGEGGFGVVFRAEQTEPVRRYVALKILKPGMDSRAVVARFEAERQALALMDHPHIARVFDAGTTDGGRPFFVMELVKGIPLTDYADRCNLTTDDRLKLLVDVCRAVQHAHQKGIIHRDLKPTNVLVAMQDGDPSVKVIDFGVAKAINQRLTDQTVLTGFQQMVGTPLYMSPEQAEMGPLDVDTRSDVYSLGVLLYELLTGTTPFQKERLKSAAYDELRRIIREEDPPKPSTRISTLEMETQSSVAERRRTSARRLKEQVRGDLDWIVMRALEKDRTRRYETANGLARDIERYMAEEPVEACPPSATYRFRKFARRNRAVIAAVAAIGVVLVTGLTATSWQAIRASRAERIAITNADRAHRAEQNATAEARRATEARKTAEREQSRATENLARAHQTVRDYLTIISDSQALELPALQTLRGELLERALSYYEEFLTQRSDDPQLELEVAGAYIRVAQICADTNRPNEAVDNLIASLEIIERLQQEHPELTQCPTAVSGFWRGFQRRSEGVNMPDDSARAVAAVRRAIGLWEGFVKNCPEQPRFRVDLAMHKRLFCDLIYSYNGMHGQGGTLNAEVFQLTDEYADESVELLEELVQGFPDEPDYRSDLAYLLMEQASVERMLGRPHLVEGMRDRALQLREALVREFPHSRRFRHELAQSLNRKAALALRRKQFTKAEQIYRRCISLADRLGAEFPGVLYYAELSSYAHSGLANSLAQQDRRDEAVATLAELVDIWHRSLATDPIPTIKNYQFRQCLRVLRSFGLTDQLKQLTKVQIDALDEPNFEISNDSAALLELFHTKHTLAVDIRSPQNLEVAEAAYRIADSIIERLIAEDPSNVEYLRWRAQNLAELADVAKAQNNVSQAAIEATQSVSEWLALLESDRTNPVYAEHIVKALRILADIVLNPACSPDTEQEFRQLLARVWQGIHDEEALGTAGRFQLAMVLKEFGQDEPAAELWQTALARCSDAAIDYNIRISSPGEYRLFVRGTGVQHEGDTLYARILEVADGPFGASADWYRIWCGADGDFSANSWRSSGGFERTEQDLHSEPMLWQLTEGEYTLRLQMRESGVAVDVMVLQLSSLDVPNEDAPATKAAQGVFEEVGGRIVIEAEELSQLNTQGAVQWVAVSDETSDGPMHKNYRGSGYVMVPVDAPLVSLAEAKLTSELMNRHHAERTQLANLARDPDDAWAHNLLAWRLIGGPERIWWDPERAKPHAEAAVRLSPFDANLRSNLGAAYYRAGDFESALTELRMSEVLAPGRFTGFNGYFSSMAEHRLGNVDKSRRWYDVAIAWHQKLQQQSWHPFQVEASTLLGDLPLADALPPMTIRNELELYEMVLAADPKVASAHVALGRILMDRGDAEQAKDENAQAAKLFDLLIAEFPDEIAVYAARSNFQESKGRTRAAIADWTKIIQRRPDLNSAWMKRGGLYAGLEAYDDAARDFAEAIERDARFFRPRYLLALARLSAADMPGYRQTCSAMVDTFLETDDMPEAKFTAWSCVLGPEAVDNFANVIQLAERAVNIDRKLNLATLGAALYRAGRYDEALSRLNQAEVLNSLTETSTDTSPAYRWYFLAMTHRRLGNTEKYRAFLNRALERTEQALASPPELDDGNWFRLATLRLLRDEAQSLLTNDHGVRPTNLIAK